MKVIIIGGVAGGATFAARFRRVNEDAEIIMFERGKYISFANCGLPYHIGDVIKSRDELLLQTPESMKAMFNLDVRTEQEVLSIDTEKKLVSVKNLVTGKTYTETFDKLVLSPGASPIKPPIPGINSSHIFTLRNVTDMDKIMTSMKESQPKRAVVIGGGFIGVEVAENLHDRGLQVTIVEMLDQLMSPIDKEMASFLHQHIKDKNVELFLENGVSSFKEMEGYTLITLQDGTEIKADLIILSIGVAAETKLAKEAGLTVERGIIVNDTFQTSHPDIYAVGDAIVVKHFLTKEPTMIPLAWPANRQARVLADILSGKTYSNYPGTLGTSILKAFDLTIAAVGLNEKLLKKSNTPYLKVFTSDNNHAEYYPGASKMTMKLLFSPEGRILGAQIVGLSGVDKRIDVLATAIKGNLSVYDLPNLELAYAPPFSSAKDPVNIAGYVAGNLLQGELRLIFPEMLAEEDFSKTQLVDIRPLEVFELAHIEGAINIPLEEARTRIKEFDKNKKIILYCQTGKKSYFIYTMLKNLGYDVYNLAGGYSLYATITAKQDNVGIFNADLETPALHSEKQAAPTQENTKSNIQVDACGLNCPGPIIKVFENIKKMQDGEILEIKATDLGFSRDIKAWSEKTGNPIVSLNSTSGVITATIQKGQAQNLKTTPVSDNTAVKDGQTLVVFSNDLDKAIATFIIANGGVAMGKKVTLFFTFWGLSILRKETMAAPQKSLIHKMFGFMMPKGPKKLALSKMNFAGMGPKMITGLMKQYQVPMLQEMIKSFIDNGGKIMACQMSMELMGLSREELMDGIDVGGVATYLSETDNSNLNLFI